MRRIVHLVSFIAALALAAPMAAQDNTMQTADTKEQSPLETRSNQVVALIRGEIEPEAIFSGSFLAQVPAPQVKAFAQSLTAQLGAVVAVENLSPATGTRAALTVRFERGLASGGIAILPGEDNRISELIFNELTPLSPPDDSAEKIGAELAALPGSVAAYFGPLDGTQPALTLRPEEPFALGSAFKLYVLSTLAREVSQGTRSWSDVTELNTKSFPSGMMQDWPQGSPVTLHTLATLMISISDNTATDQLIVELGRDEVERMVADSGHSDPGLNSPFMTTREMFELKSGPKQRLEDYSNAAGDPGARLAILEKMPETPVSNAQIRAAFSGGPIAPDVEWFASTRDMARLFKFMRGNAPPETFELMAINKGLPDTFFENWDYAGYKGGSEPGILNLTWLLTDKAGRDHLLMLSWTNPDAAVKTETLLAFAQRLLVLPR